MTEARSTPPRLRLLSVALLMGALFVSAGAPAEGKEPDAGRRPAIQNPYFEKTEWRVWRDDDTPVEGVLSMVREGKEKKAVPVTIEAPSKEKRIYPVDPKEGGPYIVFKQSAEASPKYAGMWDDVYSSWSGLHGYVRTRWRGADESNVTVRGQIMDFVDVRKGSMMSVGVNFIHQSTTSMGHAITNGRMAGRTLNFEKLYFADLLVTSPAHASLTDHRIDYSTDLYTAHVSTFFNSVGSSNSETMAITKMAIAGAYLPPETKLLLKRNGLYPAALLYIWKAALPYDEPYAHELRHRIAYKAVGDRAIYSKVEKYASAGIDRGDMSLEYHCYDDTVHMRKMVNIARSMDVALPEAVFSVIRVENESSGGYRLRKAAVVIQEKGKDISIRLSTEGCYDLQDLSFTTRWKLLYGNKLTTIEHDAEDPTSWTIKVPWVDELPEGRTAIALITNNGHFDSNPAILTIYRQKNEELPPSGMGPKDYRWPGTYANRRPILLGLQDRYVKRGKTIKVAFEAVDPEGFPVSFYKRGGEVGSIEGGLFAWRCPKKEPKGPRTVTVIASDVCGGSSYSGEAFTIHVDKPDVLAQIKVDQLRGAAPLTVKVSGKPSLGRKLKYGWDFYAPKHKRKPTAFGKMESGREATHTFEKPGIYEIALAVEGPAGKDSETIRIYVTKDAPKGRPAVLGLEGNGVIIRTGDESPDLFDHTDFGTVALGAEIVRTFRAVNAGDVELLLDRKKPIVLSGANAAEFRVTRKPSKRIPGGGSAFFDVRFKPKEAGARQARVEVRSGAMRYTFTVGGTAK